MFVDFIVVSVAFLHLWFMVLEMFYWTKPLGLRIFKQSFASAQSSKVLAFNQGLYNGFLAAGLAVSLLQPNLEVAFQFKVFFLACVVIAGIVGSLTVSRRIFWIQAFPAVLGLSILLI